VLDEEEGMTKPLALGTIVGGVILFVWGAVYHAVLPFSNQAFLAFSNEDAVMQAITAGAPRSGVYFLPYIPQDRGDEAMKAAEEKMARGPFALASVRVGPMASLGVLLGTQFVAHLLEAFLLTLPLLQARPPSYGGRILFLVAVALTGWLALSVPSWNWYSFSTGYILAELADVGIGSALAGLALARIVPKA
jgi:hypothetical protein